MKGSTNSTGVKTSELVDTISNQTVGGAKSFTGQMTASGQRAYNSANTGDVVTIGMAESVLVKKGYSVEYPTMTAPSGMTITPSDNVQQACRVVYNDSMATFEFSFGISGTFNGTSGWQPLFTSTVYNSTIPPYLLYVPVTSGHYSILWGIYLYLSNGEAINTSMRFTYTVPRNA